jgi:hypothetical protein
MDINAGTIATGEETIEEVGLKLFEFICAAPPSLPHGPPNQTAWINPG